MINSTSVLEIMETEQSLPSNRDVCGSQSDSASLPALNLPVSETFGLIPRPVINGRRVKRIGPFVQDLLVPWADPAAQPMTRSLPSLGLPTVLITWTVTRAFTVRHRFLLCWP